MARRHFGRQAVACRRVPDGEPPRGAYAALSVAPIKSNYHSTSISAVGRRASCSIFAGDDIICGKSSDICKFSIRLT